MTVIDLGYRRACKEVDEACADIKALMPKIIADIDAAVEVKRQRVTDLLDRIEADTRPPCDTEPS